MTGNKEFIVTPDIRQDYEKNGCTTCYTYIKYILYHKYLHVGSYLYGAFFPMMRWSRSRTVLRRVRISKSILTAGKTTKGG